MSTKPELRREGKSERRRYPRAEPTPRYRRLRAEIEPPPALAEAGKQLMDWLGHLRLRARLWRYRNRKAVS